MSTLRAARSRWIYCGGGREESKGGKKREKVKGKKGEFRGKEEELRGKEGDNKPSFALRERK